MSLRLSVFSSLVMLVSISTVVACGGGGGGDDGDDGDGVSASCLEAEDHSDLEWLEDNVFQRSCALSAACHAGEARMAQGLNLEAGNVDANMVGVPAQGDFSDGLNIVEPGDPDSSYLMVVVGEFGENDPRLSDVGTMPPNSPLLCQEKRDAMRRWIESL